MILGKNMMILGKNSAILSKIGKLYQVLYQEKALSNVNQILDSGAVSFRSSHHTAVLQLE